MDEGLSSTSPLQLYASIALILFISYAFHVYTRRYPISVNALSMPEKPPLMGNIHSLPEWSFEESLDYLGSIACQHDIETHMELSCSLVHCSQSVLSQRIHAIFVKLEQCRMTPDNFSIRVQRSGKERFQWSISQQHSPSMSNKPSLSGQRAPCSGHKNKFPGGDNYEKKRCER